MASGVEGKSDLYRGVNGSSKSWPFRSQFLIAFFTFSHFLRPTTTKMQSTTIAKSCSKKSRRTRSIDMWSSTSKTRSRSTSKWSENATPSTINSWRSCREEEPANVATACTTSSTCISIKVRTRKSLLRCEVVQLSIFRNDWVIQEAETLLAALVSRHCQD